MKNSSAISAVETPYTVEPFAPATPSQQRVPLYEACLAFLAGQTAPLYCPGHKGGRTLPAEFKDLIAELDLNNLAELDTLHCPSGPIAAAERLLAEAYGAAESFLLVGGSTSGNQVSVLATCKPGDEILVQRNTHKSTISGVVLAGAVPVWLTPHRDTEFGIHHGVDAAQLDRAFREHPRAVGAVVLNPTYYGTVGDIRALREVCTRYGKLLLVDEAHGPHFHFHEGLPLAAENAGADLVVQSTHKILSGLSQAAVLHKGSGRVSTQQVRKALQLVQTTSPSFPVMISIDLARRQMVQEGPRLWSGILEIAAWTRAELARIDGVRVMGREVLAGSGSGLFDLDATKIVIDTRDLGLSGREFLDLLNAKGVKPELSGPTHILAILTVGTEAEDAERLCEAVREIAAAQRGRQIPVRENAEVKFELPRQVMAPRESFFGEQEAIRLEDAAGRICAEIVTPYPPGIPVLMPGEEVSESMVAALLELRQRGFPISAATPELSHIQVVRGEGA